MPVNQDQANLPARLLHPHLGVVLDPLSPFSTLHLLTRAVCESDQSAPRLTRQGLLGVVIYMWVKRTRMDIMQHSVTFFLQLQSLNTPILKQT